jgi:hypothetical protein
VLGRGQPAALLAVLRCENLEAAARGFGLHIRVLNARTERDFDAALANAVELRVGGLAREPRNSVR